MESGATYVNFGRVRRLNRGILIEVPFTKGRLDQIRRMAALVDGLAFEYQLQLLMT